MPVWVTAWKQKKHSIYISYWSLTDIITLVEYFRGIQMRYRWTSLEPLQLQSNTDRGVKCMAWRGQSSKCAAPGLFTMNNLIRNTTHICPHNSGEHQAAGDEAGAVLGVEVLLHRGAIPHLAADQTCREHTFSLIILWQQRMETMSWCFMGLRWFWNVIHPLRMNDKPQAQANAFWCQRAGHMYIVCSIVTVV